jgi:predicted dehydrogenase
LTASARLAAGAGLSSLAVPAAAQGPARKSSPSEKVVVAVMGVRGRGRGLAQGFAGLKDAEVAYLCDVDESVVPAALKAVTDGQTKTPKVVKDFRRVLDDPAVDALVIAAPDHWHAPATIYACQAGKHVYVEKPCSHNVREGRLMVDAARRHNRVVQVGTQARSMPDRQACIEFLRSGKLGRVIMAKAVNSQRRADIGRKKDGPVPPGVDYDLWLGPAPKRPFNENRFHYNWHWFWDYGTGDLGNDGVHQVDVGRWGLGVTAPVSVTCHGGKYYFDDDQETPDTQVVVWDFGKCTLVFEQRIWAPYKERGLENGNVFYCEDGYVVLDRGGWQAFGKNDEPVPVEGNRVRGEAHLQDFVDAVKTGRKPNADIEEGHYSALLCHLGNISHRVGRRLKFDPAKETFIGDAEANRLLSREYRKPFGLPEKV